MAGEQHVSAPARAFLLVVATLLAGPAAACEGLEAMSAWVRQPPPGHEHAAAYVLLLNAGDAPVSVVGVSSPAFGSAMLHETRYEDGQARMRHLHAIELAPGERFEARPGGAHVMLGAPSVALDEGAEIDLTFGCDDGGSLTVTAPVLRRAPE